MQSNEYGVLLSASDLVRFAGCAHATTLDLGRMKGGGPAPAEDSEDAELLQRHGDAHEARHLARLRAAGRGVVEIVKDGVSLVQGVAATRAALHAALPERVRVGTVDKFQAQEAPVCLVSTTASSIEDVPCGMGFLFSPERINVATSRARGLALVFASPRLLDAACATVEEVRLVDILCALPVTGAPATLRDAA